MKEPKFANKLQRFPRASIFGVKKTVPLNILKKMVFGKEEPKTYDEIMKMTNPEVDKWFATLSDEEYDDFLTYI